MFTAYNVMDYIRFAGLVFLVHNILHWILFFTTVYFPYRVLGTAYQNPLTEWWTGRFMNIAKYNRSYAGGWWSIILRPLRTWISVFRFVMSIASVLLGIAFVVLDWLVRFGHTDVDWISRINKALYDIPALPGINVYVDHLVRDIEVEFNKQYYALNKELKSSRGRHNNEIRQMTIRYAMMIRLLNDLATEGAEMLEWNLNINQYEKARREAGQHSLIAKAHLLLKNEIPYSNAHTVFLDNNRPLHLPKPSNNKQSNKQSQKQSKKSNAYKSTIVADNNSRRHEPSDEIVQELDALLGDIPIRPGIRRVYDPKRGRVTIEHIK